MAVTLRDAYGRPLNNLRLVVTRECNYRCFFCHLEGDPTGSPRPVGTSRPEMTPRDYYILARAASRLGILDFKITGGEPLVRRDIVDVVRSIMEGSGGRAEISMTTNGYLLAMFAKQLRDAGLRRVNVSLHSLDRRTYAMITGVDGLDMALRGARAAKELGIDVKVNMTVMKSNVGEVWDLIDLAAREGFRVQLIELQPINEGARAFDSEHVSLDLVEAQLRRLAVRSYVRPLHNRPVYVLQNGVVVELVKSYDNPVFCAGCTRVRVLPDGVLTPCINYRGPGVRLLPLIRGVPDDVAVDNAVKALMEVNLLRRPYYMWRLDTNGRFTTRRAGLRLPIPKRSALPAPYQ